jgi:hypothetical protein
MGHPTTPIGTKKLFLSDRLAARGYRNDRIEEVEESRGSYLTENVDHNSQKAADRKVLQNSRTEGRPPVKRNNTSGQVNQSNHDVPPKNNSPDRGAVRGPSKNRKEVKSEVDKIRNEIAHAQEVINSLQIPTHLQNKIACKFFFF